MIAIPLDALAFFIAGAFLIGVATGILVGRPHRPRQFDAQGRDRLGVLEPGRKARRR